MNYKWRSRNVYQFVFKRTRSSLWKGRSSVPREEIMVWCVEVRRRMCSQRDWGARGETRLQSVSCMVLRIDAVEPCVFGARPWYIISNWPPKDKLLWIFLKKVYHLLKQTRMDYFEHRTFCFKDDDRVLASLDRQARQKNGICYSYCR